MIHAGSYQSCSIIIHGEMERRHQLFLASIGRLIADARRTRDLSQEELAEIVNLSRNAISAVETGTSDPRVVTLTHIFDRLGVESTRLDLGAWTIRCERFGPPNELVPESTLRRALAGAVDSMRRARGVSRETVSDRTGVHRNTIARIENGVGSMRTTTLADLYAFFGVVRLVIVPDPEPLPITTPSEVSAVIIPGRRPLHLLNR